MRRSVGAGATLFAASLLLATPAAASQILYKLRAAVTGTYTGGGGGPVAFSDPAAYLRAYGDTSQVGTALGPAQPGGAPNFNTVRLTYASGKFGPVSGAISQDYFG